MIAYDSYALHPSLGYDDKLHPVAKELREIEGFENSITIS